MTPAHSYGGATIGLLLRDGPLVPAGPAGEVLGHIAHVAERGAAIPAQDAALLPGTESGTPPFLEISETAVTPGEPVRVITSIDR